MRKKHLVILIIALALSGCSSSEPTVSEISNSTKNIVVQPSNSTQEEVAVETISNFVLPKEGIRPYAVMIDNEGVKSLPQGGMNKAQVVYEIIVEGGETRLMPVFWEVQPEQIGPVRSSRHYFLDYAMELDAIYIHYGWSPMAKSDISKFKINNANGVANGGEIFYDLTKDPRNWQDSYTTVDKVKEYVTKAKYRTTTDKKLVFNYNEKDTDLLSGDDAQKVRIVFSSSYTCSFKYDQEKKEYIRFRKDKPHMERNTGEQLTGKNIIVQYADCQSIKGDTAGRQNVKTVGKGTGLYITNGKSTEITWEKSARQSATKYMLADGNELKLNLGQTWVEIIPLFGKVSFEKP